MRQTIFMILRVKLAFAVCILIAVMAAGCKISVSAPSASPTEVTASPSTSAKPTAKKTPAASKKPSETPETEEPSPPPSETPTGTEQSPPPSGPPQETGGQQPPDQSPPPSGPPQETEGQKPPDQPSQPPNGTSGPPTQDNRPVNQGESYVLGRNNIPSIPSVLGERVCLSAETKKGAFQGTPCDTWLYKYASNTVFDDLLEYLNMLKTDYNFIHIADMDLAEPVGYTSLSVESKEPGKIIVMDCYWYTDSYNLEFFHLEGTLDRY